MAMSATAWEDVRPALHLVRRTKETADRDRDEALAWFARASRWQRALEELRLAHPEETQQAR